MKGFRAWFTQLVQYIPVVWQDRNDPSWGFIDDEDGCWTGEISEVKYRSRLFIIIRHLVMYAYYTAMCTAFDHKWIDDSYAGPDSGNMDMHCDRCGYSFTHNLY